MVTNAWLDGNTQLCQIDGQNLAVQQDDDDAAIDAWLASMTVYQFDQMLTLLMDRFGGTRSSMAVS